MSTETTDIETQISPDTGPEELRQLIAEEVAGRNVAGLELFSSEDGLRIVLPGGLDYKRPVIVAGDIALVQPDGTVVVILGAAERNVLLQIEETSISVPASRLVEISHPVGSWERLGDISPVEIPSSITRPYSPVGAGDQERVDVGDPLFGLPIHPLLPPTDYGWPEWREERYGGGAGPAGVDVDPLFPDGDAFITLSETDAPVSFRLSDYYAITTDTGDAALGFVTIGVELSGLPAGTTVSGGTLTPQSDGTLSFSFSGKIDEFEALAVTLPSDFSTESRIDAPVGLLEGTIAATSDLGDDVVTPVTIDVRQEDDIALDGPGVLELVETDAPVNFRPADALLPLSTDVDGSERITAVAFTMPGLPPGTLISLDGGSSFAPADGVASFSGSLEGYRAIVIRLPTDFSTQNPPSSLVGEVSALTNEGGSVSGSFGVSLAYEVDVDLAAPAVLSSSEDSFAGDGSGVELFLGITVAPTDDDGSEDSTTVEIVYADAPIGTRFNGGDFDAGTGVWTGTIAQAEALEIFLPGDYSGTLTSKIRAISPEGEVETVQTIEIAPAGDIDFDISDVVRNETDVPVIVVPSAVWQVSISDSDPNQPFETLDSVTLTLDGVPPAIGASPGMTWVGVPDRTITYDSASGGTLVFTGTGAQYAALRLVFPKDFSTENRSDGIAAGPITGTISAISSEDDAGDQNVPLSLTINQEGDVAIDATMPYDDLVEDQGYPGSPHKILPSDLLGPRGTDIDGSEPLAEVILVVEGLPATDENGAPLTDRIDGSYLSLSVDSAAEVAFARAADGSVTMTITLRADDVGDVLSAYNAISFSAPPDFSTANRSDLSGGETALPLTFNLTARGEEESASTIDPDASASDGLAQETRVLNIDFAEDIDLAAPLTIDVLEDGGPLSETGTTIRLGIDVVSDEDIDAGNTGIDIEIGDIDGSETEVPGNDPFTAAVTIQFLDTLWDGTSFSSGGVDVTGGFDPATQTWTGSVAEANGLILNVPANMSGRVETLITVTTLEGEETTPQTIIIEETPDANVIGGPIVEQETDAPVTVLLSDTVTIDDPDSTEGLVSVTLTIRNLPDDPGMTSVGGTITSNGDGTATLTYTYPGDSVAIADIALTFPKDFSTESRSDARTGPLVALVDIVTTDGPEERPDGFLIVIRAEGDVSVGDSTLSLVETDAPLTFMPSDTDAGGVLPVATDQDGSESVTDVALQFSGVPPGARYALVAAPAEGDFQPIPVEGLSGLTLEDYQNLTIQLPKDFSTENPSGSGLQLAITARTDEAGEATGTLDVIVSAEGDLPEVDDFARTLAENDPASPAIQDDDTTTSEPIQFKIAESLRAPEPTDADGSESITIVRVTVSGLPATGALISLDNAVTFESVANGTRDFTLAQYNALVFRLPDDFSTKDRDIEGTVTFITDEDRDDGTDTTTDGQATSNFTVTVTPEADIAITAGDIVQVEDFVADAPDGQGGSIALGLDVAITDEDGSEVLQTVTVTFNGLPTDGETVLSDGTATNISLNPTNNAISLTGSAEDIARLQALTIETLPTHFSGRIVVTVAAQSDEGDPVTESFNVDITPDAEPTIDLSVSGETVNDGGADGIADNMVVKEDEPFVLTFEAATPDRDGSERLTQIVIENVPAGWAGADGSDATVLLSGEAAEIAKISSATVTGTSITFTLVGGVTSVTAGVELTPLPNDDRDVATILGEEITATVTSVDTADSIPATDTDFDSDSIDMDVDAVVDPAAGTANPVIDSENIDDRRTVALNLSEIALTDTDGSEIITEMTLTIGVDTASDSFDPMTEMELIVGAGNAAFIDITGPTDTGGGLVGYAITRPDGVSDADFTAALEDLQLSFPQHFSGDASVDGTLSWNETQTGDVETDTSDNFATGTFETTVTVQSVAEAALTASVFVTDNADLAERSARRLEAPVKDGSVSVDEILTLLESTDDGSSPAGVEDPANGQVYLYVGIAASTPDGDGSEELRTVVIRNIPTDWIAANVTGGEVAQDAFFTLDGSGPIDADQWAKVESATYDEGTGELTITFQPNELEFQGSLRLTPTLYEDYDVNRGEDYPDNTSFDSAGAFFGDLSVELTTQDFTTLTPDAEQTDDATASAEFDVDVDPINNFARIDDVPIGNEQEIDVAGGIWNLSLEPLIRDMDGSETVTALVLRDVPNFITIFVADPANPGGPKIPALLTATNVAGPDDSLLYNVWSLEEGQFEDIEIRGIPTHFSGEVAGSINVVTTEADGGGTRVTTVDVPLKVNPVTDGGNPSESGSTVEDAAVQLVIDGNLIDNPNNSARSPEAIDYPFTLEIVDGDEFGGEGPRFFYGNPLSDPDNLPSGVTELPIVDGLVTISTEDMAQNLWVLPRQDSNNPLILDVTVTYYETIDPDGASTPITETGRVTIDVLGIADDAILSAQDANPLNDGDSPIDAEDDVAAIYKINSSYGPDGLEQIYGYAGYYGRPGFTLTQKLSDLAINDGYDVVDAGSVFTGADPLTGAMSEIRNASDEFDGSEAIYYVIDGVPDGGYIIGAQQIDAGGSTYLVSETQLPLIQFLPPDVGEVTFYDLTLYGIVYENDVGSFSLAADDIIANLADIDALPGGAVSAQPFTVVVLPDPDGEGLNCDGIGVPNLTFLGADQTNEDEGIVLRPFLTPDGDYTSLDDLINLPDGRLGNVTVSIEVPPGAEISTDPAGAAYLDPTSGDWVVDIAKLGVSADGLTTEGSITITPPPHQSSPAPFAPDETIGPDDPNYDNLNQINFNMTVNSVGCEPTPPQGSSFELNIVPVADGPIIIFEGDARFDEDTDYALGIALDSDLFDVAGGMDGGERLTGTVDITISGGGTEGVTLYDVNGIEIASSSTDGTTKSFAVAPADVAGLYLHATENFGGGTINIAVSATTEDLNGDTATNTASHNVYVDAVADTPTVEFITTATDPDTGKAYVDLSDPSLPVITIIEDTPFFSYDVVRALSPDMDGSEAVSIVVDLSQADGLEISGPASGDGFIDNGDGTYTISESAFPDLTLVLKPTHARTPDEINTSIPDGFPVSISIQTLELSNSDEATATQDIIFRVRPDADLPGLVAFSTPTDGTEDAATPYSLTLSGTTPDPHEELRFDITLPTDVDGNPLGQILLDGTVVAPDADGIVSIPTGGKGGTGVVFLPSGTVTYVPPADFAGDVSLSVVAVSIDSTDPDAIFLDTQASAVQEIDLTITPTPDLVFSIDNAAVDLDETDAAVSYVPSDDITVDVTDADGSEIADVIYTLNGVPDGTTWTSGSLSGAASGGVLTFNGTEEEFDALTIEFPADFATNDTPLDGSVEVTTNEGGSGSGTFTVAIAGELDVAVTLQENAILVTNAPGREVVEFGIDASIIPASNAWETLDEVVIDFGDALPRGTTAPNGGTLNDERTQLVLSRNGSDPLAFAAVVAALSVSIPLDLAQDFTGTVTVSTNHGVDSPVPFGVQFIDAVAAPAPAPAVFSFAAPEAGSFGEDAASFAAFSAETSAASPARSDSEEKISAQSAEGDDLRMKPTGGESDGRQTMSDVSGTSDDAEFARATEGSDAVTVDETTPYRGIEGFRMLGGDDLVDLSAATRGFAVDGGAGDDILIGSSFSDSMTGGAGADSFVWDGPSLSDIITDYEGADASGGGDVVDLSAIVQLSGEEQISERVDYDGDAGELSVDGTTIAEVTAMGGGFAEEIAVIFEDASGQQASAVV